MSFKILLVDDELDALDGVQFFFESQGMEVLTAQGGHEALALLKACRPQVILLDIKMRGMNGLEILGKAKTLDPSVTVVMVTGVSEDGLEDECRARGAAGILYKPVRIEELERIVHAAYDGQSFPRPGR